ncbi:restriction endonuclease subunit S [Phycisphaerales bacterium AB-hyl4]|uniref:Restriction endonuclease subunit S n=1 Tax=Natronomicrosphaera hydrolytica TaxID=3242702 RepID=A0ABV4U7T4_9BACT
MIGWPNSKLKNLTTKVGSGATPKGGKDAYHAKGTPLIRSLNVHMAGFRSDGLVFLNEEQAEGLRNVAVEDGDVLLNITGASIGRVAQAPPAMAGARVNQHVCIVRTTPDLVPAFLRWYLASPSQQARIMREQSGATRQGLPKGKILDFDVPVPSVDEQRCIVAKIEELFSDLDAGVAALERVRANLKRYRAAVLKAAIEGKLTEQWRAEHPDVEPASELLHRILTERRRQWEQDQLAKYEAKGKKPPKGWKDKYKVPAEPDTANLPSLPAGWCWSTIDQLISYLRNGLSKKPATTPPGHAILRINAVRPMEVRLDEVRFYDRPNDEVEGYFICNGDLLFTRYNGSVELLGVAGLVRGCKRPTLHPDKLIRVQTVLPAPLPEYVEIASNVGIARTHMASRARTTAGQTGISGIDVREMPIPLCPSSEQTEIILRIQEQLRQETRALNQVDVNIRRAARLRQAILKRAFEGRLVPQRTENRGVSSTPPARRRGGRPTMSISSRGVSS